MTLPSDDEQRLRELCERISTEHDREKLLQLIRELDALLRGERKKDAGSTTPPEPPPK